MNNILLFAGTTEGRKIAEYLCGCGTKVYVSAATEYGKVLVPKGENIHVRFGRLTDEEMGLYAKEHHIGLVIDATHPFAGIVTENIQRMSEENHIPYLRVLREQDPKSPQAVYVKSIEEAAAYLAGTEGNILITTGSKELTPYLAIPGCFDRCYVRALSSMEAIRACIDSGFEGAHLTAMQGPYSYEMNLALLAQTQAKYLVTKESGATGGYMEKIQAAIYAGAVPVVIGRPKEAGMGLNQLYVLLRSRYGIISREETDISLVGIGPGSECVMTPEARQALMEADLVIGAGRMLLTAAQAGKHCYEEYRPGEIREYIKKHPVYRKIAIALSGDVSFYSGAKKLCQVLGSDYKLRILPGISSVSYFAAKLGVSMEDTPFMSLHGRNSNPVDYLRESGRIFLIAGSKEDVIEFFGLLVELGYGEAYAAVGSRLSYEDEAVRESTAAELSKEEFDSLSVIYIRIQRNIGNERYSWPGIPDEAFIRGRAPMTKRDVRSVIISRLQLHKNSIVYDIGAGTGSISVEAAMCAIDGRVYAVEKNPEGAELIRQNQRKFHVSNIEVTEGSAPAAMMGLPMPTHAFIGGSGHHTAAVIDAVRGKNPAARIVISAITLNTVSECMAYFDRHEELDPEIVQVQIAEAKHVGDYQMMTGQNPIYIITF